MVFCAFLFTPPPTKGPPWVAHFLGALGGGFLFAHWTMIFCFFPFIFHTKNGWISIWTWFFVGPEICIRAWTKQGLRTFIVGGGHSRKIRSDGFPLHGTFFSLWRCTRARQGQRGFRREGYTGFYVVVDFLPSFLKLILGVCFSSFLITVDGIRMVLRRVPIKRSCTRSSKDFPLECILNPSNAF